MYLDRVKMCALESFTRSRLYNMIRSNIGGFVFYIALTFFVVQNVRKLFRSFAKHTTPHNHEHLSNRYEH